MLLPVVFVGINIKLHYIELRTLSFEVILSWNFVSYTQLISVAIQTFVPYPLNGCY